MTTTNTTPFDVNELYAASEKAPKPTKPIFVKATDGIQLAVRVYSPPSTSSSPKKAILAFYHGGGAHSGAGYHILANRLSIEYNIKVYTPDLRGHGKSEGPRGDSPNPEQMYRDIDTVLDYARANDNDANVPLFCGGYSSGGGLMIQYATKYKSKQQQQNDINGYLLLSPQLGPNSNVDRHDTAGFCKVSVLPFILNGIFGIMGHYPAVQFQYSDKVLNESGNVAFNTVNMANAISPTEPSKQLQEMSADNNMIHLWIGQDDELFDSEKVQKLYEPTTIVKGGTHLGILVDAHKLLGPWLIENMRD